ncbi:LysM peptidoglycan-binding domain-containing protein [Sphingobacterium sp. Mn56C]|uniref:muramidase family protein n=1 Tax=Sphingobacterium sp. Mn56C TaxID=3395261 RepID=UPI003BCBE429
MRSNKTIKSYHKISFFFALSMGLSFGTALTSPTQARTVSAENRFSVPDSVGSEIVNGERFVIHKLTPQETYYQLGRIYNVPVKDIMTVNKKKNLKVGDAVRIPRGKAVENVVATPKRDKPSVDKAKLLLDLQDITEYKVGKSETLFAISRRFGISVEDIKKVNGLTSDALREGQLLKIPNHSLPEPEPEPQPVVQQTTVPEVVEERQPIDDSYFKPNKYGIREKKEKGIGVRMDDLTTDGQTSLALHKFAPVGTILKITNPMNKSVTFAKVVGKFGDNQDTQDAIVVFSKSVATSIGALDRKFLVEITYGVPLE